MSINFAKLLIITVFMAACTSHNNIPTEHMNSMATSVPLQEYLIQPGDSLDIKFFYNPELNDLVIVRPDGRISLQLAPEIPAAGLTPAQLTAALEQRYAKELANPGITVIVRSFSSQRIYVDGEVNKPGMVALLGPLTVLQSIAEAGGAKDTAKTNQILIIRKSKDNKPLAIEVNLEQIRAAADGSQNILLAPYDVVFVPKSTIANVNQFIDQYIRRNIPIPFGVSYGIGF
ncbi:MAG: polysaccharide biosynthesis/export family protein [Geobacteraceae bacterium]|jgi:polysaccharide export outer membrane protein